MRLTKGWYHFEACRTSVLEEPSFFNAFSIGPSEKRLVVVVRCVCFLYFNRWIWYFTMLTIITGICHHRVSKLIEITPLCRLVWPCGRFARFPLLLCALSAAGARLGPSGRFPRWEGLVTVFPRWGFGHPPPPPPYWDWPILPGRSPCLLNP